VPEEIRQQLFQPFFTTKGERGTGLGLWVCRGIMTKHGGSIELASSLDPEDHGTTVSVFLATDPVINAGGA
jgi:signal transduction histidine kinase